MLAVRWRLGSNREGAAIQDDGRYFGYTDQLHHDIIGSHIRHSACQKQIKSIGMGLLATRLANRNRKGKGDNTDPLLTIQATKTAN